MPTRRRGGLVRAAVVAVACLAVVAGVLVLFKRGVGPLPDPESCQARVGGVVVDLSSEQAENATTIVAVAVRRDLPARAASLALATAYQESKLQNLDHGDRDSLGLFQQRPSQGWGTAKQIQNPYHAVNAFYDALVKVDGYQTMKITEAAQKVQRSAFPDAYADHEADGRALASALTGYSAARFSCVVDADTSAAAEPVNPDGLTDRADTVRADLRKAFGPLSLGGYAAGGVATGHMKGSAHYEGRAVDVFVRPISAANKRTGWAIASYLVAHASRLEIDHVIFDKRIWSAGARSEQGWRSYDPGNAPGDRAVLEHRDHVHVDVVAGT
ncbi:heavy metal transporter [soil metagenome]